MRFLLSILILLSFQVAHAGNSVNNGGDNVKGERLTVERLYDVISKARRDVLRHFNYITLRNSDEDLENDEAPPLRIPIYKTLFEAQPCIFKELRDVKIDIKFDGPCRDEQGKDSDGSSMGALPDSICISIPRLQDKLDEDTVWHQTLALVAHEYSHRVGFNEEQAVELQKAMLNLIQPVSRRNYEAEVAQSEKSLTKALTYVRDSIARIKKGEFTQKTITEGDLCGLVFGPDSYCTAGSAVESMWYLLGRPGNVGYTDMHMFAGVDINEFRSHGEYERKASAIFTGGCALTRPSDYCAHHIRIFFSGTKYDHYFELFKPLYISAFDGHDQAQLIDWETKFYGPGFEPNSLMIKQIKTMDDVADELQTFYDQLVVYQTDLYFWQQVD